MPSALGRATPDQQRQALAIATARLRILSRVEAERAKLAKEKARPITDPVRWVSERLREHLWSKQAQIARSVVENRATAVQSCHGAGKSYTASRIASWWLDTHEPGTAFVISTAPTYPQVRAILWREINRAHTKGNLIGRLNQTEWWIGDEIVGFGYKPNDYQTDAFQGIHARYVLVVIDEAGGIQKALFDAAMTMVTNDDCRILAIGNPDDPASHFATVCKPESGWNVLSIAAFDTPNFTGEEVSDEIKYGLVGKTWVEERRKEWGEDSPLYVSKVLGQFPTTSTNSIVRYADVLACQRLEDDLSAGAVSLGIDVGAGGDTSEIREAVGMKAGRKWSDHTSDPENLVKLAMHAIRESGASLVNIDVIGVGHGIAGHLRDLCREARLSVEIVGVNVAERAEDPERFVNLRAELWWTIGRDFSANHEWDLSEVDDATVAQLVATKYLIERRSGRIIAEPKSDVRKRLGRSPDDADALLLAFYRAPQVIEDETVVYEERVAISPY
jgi:hypothetical protein